MNCWWSMPRARRRCRAEHEGREPERGADGEQVEQDRCDGDDDAAEHDEQQHERDHEDEADGVGRPAGERVGEVVVLCRGSADERARHGRVQVGA